MSERAGTLRWAVEVERLRRNVEVEAEADEEVENTCLVSMTGDLSCLFTMCSSRSKSCQRSLWEGSVCGG